MSKSEFVTFESGCTYSRDVLDAAATEANWAKRIERERDWIEANAQAAKASNAAFGAWMMTRQQSRSRSELYDQAIERHLLTVTVVLLGGEKTLEVCSCSRAVEVPKWRSKSETQGVASFLLADGHIRVSDLSVQTLFVVRTRDGESAADRYFCQNCGILADVTITASERETRRASVDVRRAELEQLRATHVCGVPPGIRDS